MKIEIEKERIWFLRQWLNEDCITDPKRMVTNEDLEHWLISAHNREEKPTACCEKCKIVWASLSAKPLNCKDCPCHQPASKECKKWDNITCIHCEKKVRDHFPETEEESQAPYKKFDTATEALIRAEVEDMTNMLRRAKSQAPHETPTKTCTCPHCDNWRCNKKH